jgi:hypothetical protein
MDVPVVERKQAYMARVAQPLLFRVMENLVVAKPTADLPAFICNVFEGKQPPVADDATVDGLNTEEYCSKYVDAVFKVRDAGWDFGLGVEGGPNGGAARYPTVKKCLVRAVS